MWEESCLKTPLRGGARANDQTSASSSRYVRGGRESCRILGTAYGSLAQRGKTEISQATVRTLYRYEASERTEENASKEVSLKVNLTSN